MTEDNQGHQSRPGSFGDTVAADLSSGRAVDLAELYALDAVTDQERHSIEEYISSAPDSERLVFLERVRQARETLATTFRFEEEPPAGLFERIVAHLPESGAPAETESAAGADDDGDELAKARRRKAGQRTPEQRGPAATRRWLIGVAAAAAIALGGVGIGAYVADQNDPVNQVVRASDLREASVDVTGGGTATLFISPSENAAVVRMNGVPAPPPGKVYQMWLIPKDGSAAVSQGLMDKEALSKPAVVEGISSAATLGITVEPVGGSRTPTLPTVAAAPLGA